MVKFVEVGPDEIENVRYSRRGRVSYPILKGFLETGLFIARLDLTGLQQSKQALSTSLTSYIRNHNLPIKLMQRSGHFYLMRIDIDDRGNPIPDWAEKDLNEHIEQESVEITPEEVSKRFDQEKGQTTK